MRRWALVSCRGRVLTEREASRRLRGVRWVWCGVWREDGTRLWENVAPGELPCHSPDPPRRSAHPQYVEHWPEPTSGPQFSTAAEDGQLGPPHPVEELPFDPNLCSEWDVKSNLVVHKASGQRWLREEGSGRVVFRHEETGVEKPMPVGPQEETSVTRAAENISFSNLLSGVHKTSSDEAKGAAQRVIDTVSLRIEKGPVVGFSERVRDAACSVGEEAIDFDQLKAEVAELPVDDPRLTNLLFTKLDQAKAKLETVASDAASDSPAATISEAEDCLTHILRAIAAYCCNEHHRKHSIKGKPVVRTHLLSLMFNPLHGLYPLLSPEEARMYLLRMGGFIASYEASRSLSPAHAALSTLSECVMDVALLLRRQRVTSRFHRIDEAKKAESEDLLRLSSATHNAFLFWSSVRPGGYPLQSDAHFMAGVINGVWGTYEAFVTELKQQARVAADMGGGWVWLVVSREKRRRRQTGDLRRFVREEEKPTATTDACDALVPLSGTSIILSKATESVRGRILGFDIQIMTTHEQTSPLTEGCYPLAGVELWGPALREGSRSSDDYMEAWLSALDWRIVEFQLRTCYKADLDSPIAEYNCIAPLGSDTLHAVWLDMISTFQDEGQAPAADDASLAVERSQRHLALEKRHERYVKARRELGFLTGGGAFSRKETGDESARLSDPSEGDPGSALMAAPKRVYEEVGYSENKRDVRFTRVQSDAASGETRALELREQVQLQSLREAAVTAKDTLDGLDLLDLLDEDDEGAAADAPRAAPKPRLAADPVGIPTMDTATPRPPKPEAQPRPPPSSSAFVPAHEGVLEVDEDEQAAHEAQTPSPVYAMHPLRRAAMQSAAAAPAFSNVQDKPAVPVPQAQPTPASSQTQNEALPQKPDPPPANAPSKNRRRISFEMPSPPMEAAPQDTPRGYRPGAPPKGTAAGGSKGFAQAQTPRAFSKLPGPPAEAGKPGRPLQKGRYTPPPPVAKESSAAQYPLPPDGRFDKPRPQQQSAQPDPPDAPQSRNHRSPAQLPPPPTSRPPTSTGQPTTLAAWLSGAEDSTRYFPNDRFDEPRQKPFAENNRAYLDVIPILNQVESRRVMSGEFTNRPTRGLAYNAGLGSPSRSPHTLNELNWKDRR
ncbi:hypothetical protein DIPPA_29032 [Diplonema papillatum]|nr:hypothetical protein DIPPA_29032 [Diplonema papillatum]